MVLSRSECNAGVVASRNRGLALAQGEYIAVQDADDISYPERLALQVNCLETHPQLGAVGSAAKRIDEQGNMLSIWQVPAEHDTIKAQLLFTSPISHSTLTARHQLVKQLGGYQEGLDSVEDYDLWWRLSRITRLAALTEPLISYRSSGHPQRLTVEQAPVQLKGSQEISLGIAKEIMGSSALDKEAYRRFFLASRGVYHSLQAGDIRRLQPLWDTLAADPIYRKVLMPRLLSFSMKLSHSQPREALQLLVVAKRQFNAGAYEIGRKLFQTYAPPPVERVGRYLKRGASRRTDRHV
jgi:glycosyltransferase involved in cell wall biosynthesis